MSKNAELWYPRSGVEVRRSRTSRTTPDPDPDPATPKWPGDPGDGNFYVGGSLGPNGNTSIANLDNNVWWPGDAQMSVIHNYSTNNSGVNGTMLDEAINRGFIPSQSFKMPSFSTAQIIAGTADSAIDTLAATCAARDPWPIWLCYFHEPEDDFSVGTAATNYRAAYRRIVTRVKAAGVTNVMWQPIFQNPWTFGGSGRDWRNWHCDWTGSTWNDTILMDVMGMDTYDPVPWSVSDGGHWYEASRTFQTFPQLWTKAFAAIEKPGYPVWDYTIPEFGMSNAFSTDPDWSSWCDTAITFAKAHRIKAFQYWDNSDDIGRWSMGPKSGVTHPDVNGTKLEGWNKLVDASVKWEEA